MNIDPRCGYCECPLSDHIGPGGACVDGCYLGCPYFHEPEPTPEED